MDKPILESQWNVVACIGKANLQHATKAVLKGKIRLQKKNVFTKLMKKFVRKTGVKLYLLNFKCRTVHVIKDVHPV